VIEPYYERDRRGPDAAVYQGMGEVVYATLANSGRALADAAAVLDVALASDTTRGDAQFLLGVAEEQLGHTDDAIRDLERSVRADSSRPDRLRALAQAYEHAGRAPAEIDHLYGRALALQPALAWIRADYADYLQSHGRLEEATKAYQAALTEQPSLAVARFNLGAVLAGEGKLRESSAAFQEAVHLDPSLAQALSPLFEIRTSAKVVTDVRTLDAPLASLPVRERDPHAAALALPAEPGPHALLFINVPPHGVVQILKPDGSVLRSLPTGEGVTLRWDLLLDTGSPIAAGLYRARVLGHGPGGRAAPPQGFFFGVVRERGG
jgi:tetratricopeptide (TPR) repeat protein